MREAILIPFAALALAACSDEEEKEGTSISINARSESGKDVVIDADGKTGAVRVQLPGVNADLTLPKVMLDNADFDIAGVELYPGSSVRSLNVVADKSAGKDTAMVRVDFVAPADPGTVQNWFVKEFASHSVDVNTTGKGVSGKTTEGDAFSIDFTADGAKTNGTIKIVG